jgi:hypothetical protein
MRPEEAISTSTGGIAWPVVVIGGLIILASLGALRGEFRNWRMRRSERSQSR